MIFVRPRTWWQRFFGKRNQTLNTPSDSCRPHVEQLEDRVMLDGSGVMNLTAVDDFIATGKNTPITVNLLANDLNPNGGDLTIVNIGLGTRSSAVLNPDQTVTLTPFTDEVGTDGVPYEITNGTETASGMLFLDITPPVVPPLAPTADDLYAAYEAAVAQADLTYNASLQAAAAARQLADYDSARAALDAAINQAEIAMTARIVAAQAVYDVAVAGPRADLDQAMQIADGAYYLALQTSETTYNDTLTPYQTAVDAAQAAVAANLEDTEAQAALSQAQQVLSDAQSNAAAVRDVANAGALAALQSAEAEAQLAFDTATAPAWAMYDAEFSAAQDDFATAESAAWDLYDPLAIGPVDQLAATYQAALDLADQDYAIAHEAAQTVLENALTQAETAMSDRVAAAQAVYDTAVAGPYADLIQAVQAAMSAYDQALQASEAAYQDALAPYQANADAAQATVVANPEDVEAQVALSQAQQALSDAQTQAAAVRDAANAEALAMEQSAEADAYLTYETVTASALAIFESEATAAQSEYDLAEAAAWDAYRLLDDTAQAALADAEQAAWDAYQIGLTNVDAEERLAVEAAQLLFDTSADAALVSWQMSEQTAWAAYTDGLALLPEFHVPQVRSNLPTLTLDTGAVVSPYLRAETDQLSPDESELVPTIFAAPEEGGSPVATTNENWRQRTSPFFAHTLGEAKDRAFHTPPTNPGTDTPVGETVANEFGVNADMTWGAFFSWPEYRALLAQRTTDAAALTPEVLYRLDAAWNDSPHATTWSSTIGALASTWQNVGGFDWVQPETTWREFYSYQAWSRIHTPVGLEAIATRPAFDQYSSRAAEDLIRMIVADAERRAAAYDALLRIYEDWVDRPGLSVESFVSGDFVYGSIMVAGAETIATALQSVQSLVHRELAAVAATVDAKARLGALLLSGPLDFRDGRAWAETATAALTPRSQANESWAIDALNIHLTRLDEGIERYAAAAHEEINAIAFIPARRVERLPADQVPQLGNGGAAQLVVRGGSAEDVLADVRNQYATYAQTVLDVLDMFPNKSGRSRLLNALEVVSGKLVEAGQTSAAARVLMREVREGSYFWTDVGIGEFRTRVVDLVQKRADAYDDAPVRALTAADRLRTAALAVIQQVQSTTPEIANADDRTYLQGLAEEAVAQAELIKASAENAIKTMSLGLVDRFQALAEQIIGRDYPETSSAVYDALGNAIVTTTRPSAYYDWMLWVRALTSEIRRQINDDDADFAGAIELMRRNNRGQTTVRFNEVVVTPQRLVDDFRLQKPIIWRMLNGFASVYRGYSLGENTPFTTGQAAIGNALVDAGLYASAAAFIDNLVRTTRDQQGLQVLYDLQNRLDWQRTQEGIANFVRDFVVQELPLLAATTVLSCGSVSLAYATWRVVTGVRLARSVLIAAEMAVSVPINQAVNRAAGQTVDDSLLGTLRQAGFAIGTQFGFRILGSA